MKNLFAILFSLLLITGQTAFPAQADKPFPQKNCPTKSCACAHCLKPCCLGKTAPTTPASPAAPVRAASQTNWQPLISTAQLLLEQPAATASLFPSPHTFVPSANHVPLYSRNCSYLI